MTISRDPVTGDRVTAADPLVRTYGAEFGIRNESIPKVVNTLSAWYLKSDSELVYVGDAGTSEPGPASQKYGVELSSYWRPTDWAMVDVEATATYAELLDTPEGRFIPGSVPYTLNTGITLGKGEGFFGSLRGRFFGPRPLIEDGSVESREAFQVNARIGYRRKNWEVAVDCLNLFGRNDNDIVYFYESQLRGESAPREDQHFHPIEPRMFRVSLTYRW
jgi:outer membrane receptor protein involved in Fe transport